MVRANVCEEGVRFFGVIEKDHKTTWAQVSWFGRMPGG